MAKEFRKLTLIERSCFDFRKEKKNIKNHMRESIIRLHAFPIEKCLIDQKILYYIYR